MVQLDMFENISDVEILLTEFSKVKENYERCQRSFFEKLGKLEKKAERLIVKEQK
jgi:hypothetical protein